MTNILLLVICFSAGVTLRRTGRFPETTATALNGFIIHISLPALALLHIHSLKLDPSLAYTAFMAWFVFGAGFVFFTAVGRTLRLERKTVGALIVAAGLGNTSFVGLPMIEAYYGSEFLGVGLVADQFGSFLVLSTLGIFVAAAYSSGEVSVRAMARKILFFPPFQALVLAVLLRPFEYPQGLAAILRKLGDTLTPLALVSVGFQLRLHHLRGELRPLFVGLSYKLLLAPALFALLVAGVLGQRGEIIQVTIFEAAMAPMITAGIIASDHDLNPGLVSLLLGIGIPLSFLTLPLWWQLLRTLGI